MVGWNCNHRRNSFFRFVRQDLQGEMVWRFGWWGAHKEVNGIRHHLQPFNRHAQCSGRFVQEGFQSVGNLPVQHLAPVRRAPDKVIVQRGDATRVFL